MTVHRPRNVLVTGGAGFIGSNFVHQTLGEHPDVRIVNLDLLTYAGNPDNLEGVMDSPRHVFTRGDILDDALVTRLLEEYEVDSIVHFAAFNAGVRNFGERLAGFFTTGAGP